MPNRILPVPVAVLSDLLVEVLSSGAAWRIYGRFECGPFDGCCLLIAEALKAVLGQGDFVYVVGSAFSSNAPPVRQHAALFAGGWCFDADGACSPDELVLRWKIRERVCGQEKDSLPLIEFAPEPVLEGAVRDAQARMELEDLMLAALRRHHDCGPLHRGEHHEDHIRLRQLLRLA